MGGLSRWDLVLWFVAAYVACTALVRLMLYQRGVIARRLADEAAVQQRRAAAERRKAA